MKPPEVRASLLFNRQMSYFVRNCLSATTETSTVFQQHLLRYEVSRGQEQSRSQLTQLGRQRVLSVSTGRLALKWILPFAVNAWSLPFLVVYYVEGSRRALMNFLRSVSWLPYSIV